ncbi:MAG: hypothetical protein MJ247_04970 [Alphaproteobacteria bacterium]|nr:hypothetical protein [Alphaproteobacteria bacterium]
MVDSKSNIAELEFYDALARLRNAGMGVAAIYFTLKDTDIVDQKPNFISAIQKLVADKLMEYFDFQSGDCVFICKNMAPSLFASIQDYVTKLFLLSAEKIRLFRFESDFESLLRIARNIRDKHQTTDKVEKKEQKDLPLSPEYLDAILHNIMGFNILHFLRRQEAVRLSGKAVEGIFYEYFTSIGEIKKQIAPKVDILSNKWLFQYLSRFLDLRMLSIAKDLFMHTKKCVSLNLNIETLSTFEFDNFLDQKPDNVSLIAEVQLFDIIENPKAYCRARDLLRRTGNKILIDSLQPISFNYIDLNKYDADFYKLLMPIRDMNDDESEMLKLGMSTIDPEKIIMMRVEKKNTLIWGLENNITRFQGYLIDDLVASACKKRCSLETCSKRECRARKERIWGKIREACEHPELLDEIFENNLGISA